MSAATPAAPAKRAYTPHRGSYPEAAWNVLGEHAELSSAALAEAIGCDATSVHAIMAIPIKHGMLATAKREGLLFWRRGDHAPAPRPFDAEDDEPLNGAPHANGKLPASSIFDLAMRQVKQPPAAKPPEAPPKVPPPPAAAKPTAILMANATKFRVGLFSDGELRIEWRGLVIELEREQTEQLVRFLDRLARDGDAA